MARSLSLDEMQSAYSAQPQRRALSLDEMGAAFAPRSSGVTIGASPAAPQSGPEVDMTEGAMLGAPVRSLDLTPRVQAPHYPASIDTFPSLMHDMSPASPAAPGSDPELADFYSRTTLGERALNPLRAGLAQTRQGVASFGADVVGRFAETFERARRPAGVSPAEPAPPEQAEQQVHGVEVRQPFPAEIEYFRKNPHVAGMAAEDNRIIINPHSKLQPHEIEAVKRNEAARVWMRTRAERPQFRLTDQQQRAFGGYGTPQDQMETLVGRIISGDPSALDVTPEQRAYADKLLTQMGGVRQVTSPRPQAPPMVPLRIFEEDRLEDIYSKAMQRATPEQLDKLLAANQERPRLMAQREIARRRGETLMMPDPNWTGRTPEGRQIVGNADGSFSSERSITVQVAELNGGRPTNIPTMFNGQSVSEDEAIRRIVQAGGRDPETGRALPGFNTIDEAVAAAKARSNGLGVPAPNFGGTTLGARDLAQLRDMTGSGVGELRGGLIDAMRRQTPEEADATRTRAASALTDAVKNIVARNAEIRALDINPAQTRMMSAKTFGEAGEQFWRDPLGVIMGVGLQSLPQTAPGIVAGIAGGPVAGATVMGGTSALSEYAGAILDQMSRMGVNINDEGALKAAFSNPTLMEQLRGSAATRGAIIGGVDAATMGLASKTLAPKAITNRMGRELANVPAQIGAQAAAGGGAETAAQLATEGRITEPGQILAEVVGEGITAPAEVAALAMHRSPQIASDNVPYQTQAGRPERREPIPPAMPSGPVAVPESSDIPVPMPRPAPSVGAVPIFTPGGSRVEAEPDLMEAGQLVASHTDDLSVNPFFPADLQPRERERAASQAQIADIAGNLQPEMLGITPSAAEGAPIVGPDNVIESGNARTLAVRRAYREGLPGGEAYRQWLEGQGYNTAGFKEPILVRRRVTPMSHTERQEFTRAANQRSTLAPSATEAAASDAKTLSPELLDLYRGGGLESTANAPFVRQVIAAISTPAERGALLTPDGTLSQEGTRRIQNALFSIAYDDPQMLSGLRESPDFNIKAIGEALASVAIDVARVKRTNPQLDPAPALVAAARLISEARRDRMKVSERANQTDMFAGRPAADTKTALRLFFRDDAMTQARSGRDIAGAIRFYVDQASRNVPGSGLFQDQAPVTPADIFKLTLQRLEGDLLPNVADARIPSTGKKFISLAEMQTAYSQAPAVTTQAMAPGANYIGFHPDTLGVMAGSKELPLRRGEILSKVFKTLMLSLYTGRIKGKGTLGFFRKPIEEVRIKRANDMETAIHEVAHALDFRFPELRQQWTPASNANAVIRSELSGVSYDKTKLYEGFAEFVRLWATQKNRARAAAPNFYSWFDGWLAGTAPPDVAAAMTDFQQGAHEWFAQDALTRARSKIGPEADVNEAQVSFWSNLRQSTLDDLEGIRRMEYALEGDLLPAGAYETARLTRGAAEIINGALTLGTLKVLPDGSHTFEGKSLADILKPVQSRLDDFEMYAVGRAADELRGQGREHLFTPAEIQAMLSLETPDFRRAFEDYQAWNAAVLDFAQAKGVISGLSRSFWQRQNYLPFHRVGTPQGSQGHGVSGSQQPVKALLGGTENIKNPLQNMIANAAMLIKAALQNEARAKVVGLAKQEGGARFMAEIPTEERQVRVSRDQIEQEILAALGVTKKSHLTPEQRKVFDQIIQNMGPVAELMVRGQAPAGGNVVAFLDQGKPRYFEVADSLLFRALQSLNREAAQGILRVVGAARRLGQAGVTLTPDFAVANFLRDQAMALIMTRNGFLPFIDGARGIWSRLTRDQNYKDFIANGGGIASHVMDESDYRNQLDMFYSSKGIAPSSVMNTPVRLKNVILRISEAAEVATRLGEFRKAVKRGKNPRHAAYSAREVSTDFAMRGDAKDVLIRGDAATISFLYDAVMFLKAGMNGLERFYRGVRYDENKWRIVGMTAGLALASAALYTVNSQIPEYQDLEDWDKDTHWHIFIPNGQGGRLHFRLPKLWEIGAISSLAERTMEAIEKGFDKESALRFFNVVRGSMNLDPIPQVINPILEIAMNKDRFTGRPIEPMGIESLEPWARATPGTSATMRALGEATRGLPQSLQISPAQAEHLLRGYLSTWGGYLTDISDAALFSSQKPDKRVDQLPVVRRFYREEPASSTRHVTELYKAIAEAHKVRNTMRAMDRQFRPEIAAEMENRPENLMYRQLSVAERRLRAVNQDTRRVLTVRTVDGLQNIAIERAQETGNPALVETAKRIGVWDDIGALRRFLADDISAERNALAKSTNLDVKARRKELESPPAP